LKHAGAGAETRLLGHLPSYPQSGSAYRTSDQRATSRHANRVHSAPLSTPTSVHTTPRFLHRVIRCNAAFPPSFVAAAQSHDGIAAHFQLSPPTTFSGIRASSTGWNSTRCFLQPFENSTRSSRGLRVNDAEISSPLIVDKTNRKISEI
jgi:hypothetical protein